MRRHVMRGMLLVLAMALASDLRAQGRGAQSDTTKKEKKSKSKKADSLASAIVHAPKGPAPLFTNEKPLELRLATNWGLLKRQRGQSSPEWIPSRISYAADDGKTVALPVRVRGRGIWRLHNCEIPPIRFNFVKDSVKESVFAKLDKPKLVSVCRDRDEYDEYLLEEYQLYRVLNKLTPLGFLARLAKVTYVDTSKAPPKVVTTRWAFVTEDAAELGDRTGLMPIDAKGAARGDIQVDELTVFGLFQYLIGNTDFGISSLHNVQLVQDDTAAYAIPYDFDWSGAVGPPYAVPNPTLGLRSVEQRLYRGFCTSPDVLERAITRFVAEKDGIYALYSDDIGKLLRPDRVKRVLSYFDDFYRTVTDPKKVRRDIVGACL